jgi:hypothetical protein
VEPEGEKIEAATFSVPSRVVARELKVPLWDPPEPRSRSPIPFDPDTGPLRRLSPRKSWPEVVAIDEKLDRIDKQRVGLGERIGRLDQAISEARREDQQSLATWQLAGAEGKRPFPKAPALEAELEQVRSDLDATAIAEDRILREKTEFVERHRKRLISDAAKVRSRAVKNLQDAITVVEQAREEATTALQTERWAREFPGELANPSTLSVDFLKGGRLSKAMPEVRTLTVATSVLEWLRDDAAWINSALADAAERPLDPHEQSVWEEAPEGREAIALANKRVRLGLEPRAVRQAEWFD